MTINFTHAHSVHSSPSAVGTDGEVSIGVEEVSISVGDGVKMEVADE